MIVDTSAVLAILFNEPDAAFFAAAIEGAPMCMISAGSVADVYIILESRRIPGLSNDFERLMVAGKFMVEPVTADQALAIGLAYRQFGKGIHPARLNYGDCFSYTLAKLKNQELLFKGNDFSQTDIPGVSSGA
ncbi:MAG: type II toxin-antitoxin system VapC family toxin [Candidatus Sumerlaeota bacterium]